MGLVGNLWGWQWVMGLIADLWGWEWVMGLLRADLWGRRCVGPLGASAGREERREGIIGVN